MQGYRYQHGDRPLEGYTIRRAVGRGGFGEVYYAVSDGGREVALKAIQGYEDVELRGVRQCMNLKSPHLVTIFDIRRNDAAQWFVIMEYVSGPSLRDLLAGSPGGLGPAKAGYFLREIAKGLSFLHEAGIVHRDLKPGNIFYEDGIVKIGDYGLSKAIAPSRHEGQTITVGTVHYMAPEIGAGCYDRSIDIYALGVVLYEMLTRNVPYAGSSHGEILMKHMTASPDLSALAEPMASVVAKALAKDPAQRYPSATAMAEALFGVESIRQSVSTFCPASLTMVAGRVAGGLGAPASPPPRPQVAGGPGGVHVRRGNGAEVHVGAGGVHVRHADGREVRVGPAGVHVQPAQRPNGAPMPAPGPPAAPPAVDPLTFRQRVVLAGVATLTIAVASGLLAPTIGPRGRNPAPVVAVAIVAAGAALMLARQHLPLQGPSANLWRHAFRPVAAGAAVLAVWMAEAVGGRVLRRDDGTALFVGLLVVDWWRQMDRQRAERVSLRLVIWAAVAAFMTSLVLDGNVIFSIAVAAGLSLVVQVLSPYRGPAPATAEPAPGDPSPSPAPAPPPPPASRDAVSPRRRLAALVLALLGVMGFNGLHRFYVGKIGTGLLWLLTFGLVGIGQIVDFILILAGRFRDSRGRRLVVWENWSELAGRAGSDGLPLSPPAPSVTRPGPFTRLPVNPLLSALAGVLLLSAVAASIAAATVPNMIRQGVFGGQVSDAMVREFGTNEWPAVLNDLGVFIAGILLTTGAALLILARRRAGLFHVVRGLLGVGGLLMVCVAGYGSLERLSWSALAAAPQSLGRMLTVLCKADTDGLVFAMVFLVGWWPLREVGAAPMTPRTWCRRRSSPFSARWAAFVGRPAWRRTCSPSCGERSSTSTADGDSTSAGSRTPPATRTTSPARCATRRRASRRQAGTPAGTSGTTASARPWRPGWMS